MNNTMKRSIFLLAAVLFLAVSYLSSCKDDDKDKSEVFTVKSVTFVHATIDLPLGDEDNISAVALTYTLEPAKASNIESVSWSSSNTEVATVSQSGLVTSISLGETTITVNVKTTEGANFSHTCTVNVVSAPIRVDGVEIEDNETSILPGAQLTLVAIISPEDANIKTVGWTSSNEEVAIVTQGGLVIAVDIGTAIITVTTVDGQFKAQYEITVEVPVSGVQLTEKTKLILEVGDEDELFANVLPEDATNTNISWESNNTDAVTVDNDGKIKAVGIGAATITVTTEDGDFTDTREIEVMGTYVSSVKLGDDIHLETVYEGGVLNEDSNTRTLSATVEPANANNKKVTWESSDTDVAVVSESGVLTIKDAGTATITVTTDDGGYTDALVLTVDNFYSFLDRSKWSIVGYDPDINNDSNGGGQGWSSQAKGEGDPPNGRITALLNDNVNQFWHSSWGPDRPYPHWFIVDLGEEVEFEAVMLQRRQGNNTGSAKGYAVRTSNAEADIPMNYFNWVDRGEYDFDPDKEERQINFLDDGVIQARYIMLYFDEKYKGSSTFVYIATFGLYIKK